MKETWKDIPGYIGLYQVSNLGKIKSLSRITVCKNGSAKKLKEKIIKPTLWQGYYRVALSKDGKNRRFLVHRLVMLAFNGDSEMAVNHKNGDSTDNSLENLEYVTQKQNLMHSTNILKRGHVANTKKDNPTEEDLKNRKKVSQISKRKNDAYSIVKNMYLSEMGIDAMHYDYSRFDDWLTQKKKEFNC